MGKKDRAKDWLGRLARVQRDAGSLRIGAAGGCKRKTETVIPHSGIQLAPKRTPRSIDFKPCEQSELRQLSAAGLQESSRMLVLSEQELPEAK